MSVKRLLISLVIVMSSSLVKCKKPPRASEYLGCPGWLFPKSCSFVWALTWAYTALSSLGVSVPVGTVSLATRGATGASVGAFCSVAFSASASSSACVSRFQHEVSLGELFAGSERLALQVTLDALEEFLGDLECHGSAFFILFLQPWGSSRTSP